MSNIHKLRYDEDLVISLIDSSTLEEVGTRLIQLSLEYQTKLDIYLAIEEPNADDTKIVDDAYQELASYLKALQVMLG